MKINGPYRDGHASLVTPILPKPTHFRFAQIEKFLQIL
jgi:hypothetical protein